MLDPTSGYGTATQLAVERGISAFCLELNEPQYLWQVLTHPLNREVVTAVTGLLRKKLRRRRGTQCAVVSEELYPEPARVVIRGLRDALLECVPAGGISTREDLADAVILPFVGRLACMRPSHNPAHVKRGGGICVLRGWEDDFRDYMDALGSLLSRLPVPESSELDYGLALGDARDFDFGTRAFDAVLTSPPYPNRADYSALFLPEIDYLSWARHRLAPSADPLIGSVLVSERTGAKSTSSVAAEFLERADDVAKAHGAGAAYDQRVYYRPYFEEYFGGLELAWVNAERALSEDSLGYIVVVNNTHRGLVVPVAEFVQEVWRGLGFEAEVSDTSEHTHVGTKNPRARGVRAVHSRHVIEIRRQPL